MVHIQVFLHALHEVNPTLVELLKVLLLQNYYSKEIYASIVKIVLSSVFTKSFISSLELGTSFLSFVEIFVKVPSVYP